MNFIKIGLIFTLLFIAYQDFKTRRVLFILFPVALILVILYSGYKQGVRLWIFNFLINILTTCLQLGLSILFIKLLKQVKISGRVNNYLGLGDILFLPILSAYFSVYSFLIFLIVSQSMIILIWFLYNSLKNNKQIPLAGFWSVMLAVIVIYDSFI